MLFMISEEGKDEVTNKKWNFKQEAEKQVVENSDVRDKKGKTEKQETQKQEIEKELARVLR